MVKTLVFSIMLTALLLFAPAPAFAQSAQPAEHQLTQPVIIDGQQTQGVTLMSDGKVQKPSCASPQSYVTVDDSSRGWACFDEVSGTWLLRAHGPENYLVA